MAVSSATEAGASAEISRFVLLSEEELSTLVSDKDSKRTKNVIKCSVSILQNYCAAVGKNFAVDVPHQRRELKKIQVVCAISCFMV